MKQENPNGRQRIKHVKNRSQTLSKQGIQVPNGYTQNAAQMIITKSHQNQKNPKNKCQKLLSKTHLKLPLKEYTNSNIKPSRPLELTAISKRKSQILRQRLSHRWIRVTATDAETEIKEFEQHGTGATSIQQDYQNKKIYHKWPR
jgi:hypothetical protein